MVQINENYVYDNKTEDKMNISLITSDCVMPAKQGQRSLLTAKVTDGLGRPVAGQQVCFLVEEGGGGN